MTSSEVDVLTHVFRLAVGAPGGEISLSWDDMPKFAEGTVELLGRFGWGLAYDPASLQDVIDEERAKLPPVPEGGVRRPPELHHG